jgi:hypothetical protein
MNMWEARIHTYVDEKVVEKELKKHIELEDSVLRKVENTIALATDEAVKLLLAHIADDIKEHHKAVQLMIKRAYAQ